MSSSTPIILDGATTTTPTSNVGTPISTTPGTTTDPSSSTSTPLAGDSSTSNTLSPSPHSQLLEVNYWDKIQKILKKMDQEVQQVNQNGLIHPLQMSDNILERRESLKHAISILKQRVEEQLTVKPRSFLEKTQQQSKSVKEFNRIHLQERELVDAIQKCTEKVLTHYQHQQLIERILNSVAKEMNEFIGREDYVSMPITDLINLDCVIGYSMGCDILNLDVEFNEMKELKSIKFQKTKQSSSSASGGDLGGAGAQQHKEIKPISEDLLNTLMKEKNPELFEKKLLDVCKLYHLVATRPNCIVTDKASLRLLDSSCSSFLKSTSVMREFEHYITREGNFPSDKVSVVCEGVSINYYRNYRVIVTLEGCAGNALQQTCPVMIFNNNSLGGASGAAGAASNEQSAPQLNSTFLIPLYTARSLNFLQSIISSASSLKKSTSGGIDSSSSAGSIGSAASGSSSMGSAGGGIGGIGSDSMRQQQLLEEGRDFTKDMSIEQQQQQYNKASAESVRVLETFQNCLLSGYSTVSAKRVQSNTYNFVASTSDISEKLATNSGVFIRRVPFLNFDQMRYTLSVMKKHLLLNDLFISCFTKVQDSTRGLLDNICTTHHHTSSSFSKHHHGHTDSNSSNQRRVEVEYSTPDDIIYLKTTTENDFIEIRIDYDQNKEQAQVFVKQILNDAMTDILNKSNSIPIMVHYFFTKVSMQL